MELNYNVEEENKTIFLYRELAKIQTKFMQALQIAESLKQEKEELENKIKKLEEEINPLRKYSEMAIAKKDNEIVEEIK